MCLFLLVLEICYEVGMIADFVSTSTEGQRIYLSSWHKLFKIIDGSITIINIYFVFQFNPEMFRYSVLKEGLQPKRLL